MSAIKPANVEWVRCYYDAFNRRDWEWVAAMLAPEVEWYHTARDERVRGVGAVIASFRSFVESSPTAQIDLLAAHDAGPVIVAECGIRHARKSAPPPAKGGALKGGPIHQASFCEVLTLAGGHCVRGSTYADSVRLLLDINQAQVVAA